MPLVPGLATSGPSSVSREIGWLFAIYLSLNLGEMTLLTWFSLIAQLLWVLIGIWFAGRLIESEGILEISYKRLLRFRRM